YKIDFNGYSFYGQADTEAGELPYYVLLVDSENDIPEEMVHDMDELFRESNEKYEKYRRWGMLGEPHIVRLQTGTYDEYKKMLVSQGRVLNQIKPVTVINTPERKEFFFARTMDGAKV
ncbi:MAG: GH3 auxin-responsive promoter family protein, partial [Acutalibacteraceae bacterium]